MYYQYFGLTEEPFSIAVNPRYLFMSARHRDALAHLLYGVGAGGGFILLTGEVGTGKTTINRCLLEQLPDNTDIAIILNPALNAVELLATACDELGIDYNADQHTLKTLTDGLQRFLLDNHERGRKTVLLIDEAQHLDFDVLEQVRLLTNLETNSEKLLQIILIGQPELAQMLARPELRQLNQRITARYNLEPLNLEETGAYIRHRLQVAGMSPDREIFPPAVVRGIYEATRGIPRVINVLCDRILLGTYGRNETRADRAMLALAKREVLGDEAVASWRWPLAIVGGLALVVALVIGGGWLLLGGSTSGVSTPDVSTPGAPVAVAPGAVTAEPSTNAGSAPVVPSTPVLPVESPQRTPLAAERVVVPNNTLRAQSANAARPPPVLKDPGDALRSLWALYGVQALPTPLCPGEPYFGVLCAQSEAETWDDLARLDRPLVLSMITPDRFSAEVLLAGIEGQQAWIASDAGIVRVALAELASLWTGEMTYLWRPPAGFDLPLSRGDRGAVVAELAQRFARLDGQAQPLTRDIFNNALEQRVRLFQQRNALEDDGVGGVRTLLRLNERLGVDITAAAAREQLSATPAEAVQP